MRKRRARRSTREITTSRSSSWNRPSSCTLSTRWSICWETSPRLTAVKFLSENRVILDLLAEAYVGSRYMDVEYGRETAEEALRLLERFKDEFNEEIR